MGMECTPLPQQLRKQQNDQSNSCVVMVCALDRLTAAIFWLLDLLALLALRAESAATWLVGQVDGNIGEKTVRETKREMKKEKNKKTNVTMATAKEKEI